MQKQEFFVPGPLPGLNEIIAASKIVGLTKSCRRIPGINYSKMKAIQNLLELPIRKVRKILSD